MALTELWFDATDAGAANGSSWANRDALFDSGTWSALIRAHDFTTSGGLICYIGKASYSQSQVLTSAIFSVSAPSAANPLILVGADTSGVVLTFDEWTSPEVAAWESDIPDIAASDHFCNLNDIIVRGIKLAVSGTLKQVDYGSAGASYSRCVIQTSYNSSAADLMSPGVNASIEDCVFRTTQTSWDHLLSAGTTLNIFNCRFEGGGTGGSGDRDGVEFQTSGNSQTITNCTVIDCPGNGIVNNGGGTSARVTIRRCTIDSCGTAIKGTSTASQADHFNVSGNVCTNGTYGIDPSASRFWIHHNRLRDNSSGNINTGNLGNYPDDADNYVTDSDDATEYVDAGAGDYRIKNTATAIWGKGYGAGDEAAAGGGGGPLVGGRLVR